MSTARAGAFLLRWHRRAGIAACVFLAWLAISGIALNHGAALGIDRIHLHAAWLLRLYGLEAGVPAKAYASDGHWLAVGDGVAVLDGRRLDVPASDPVGLASANGLLGVATADRLMLFLPDGTRADEIRAPDLPVAHPVRIGRTANRFVIAGDAGAWSSADGLAWTAADGAEVEWSAPRTPSAEERESFARAGAPEVSLEQALIDAHSGRLLGRYGPLLADFAAVCAVLLALSGAWMFLRRSRRR